MLVFSGMRLDFVSSLLPLAEVAGFGGRDFMGPCPLCSFDLTHIGLRNRTLALSVCGNDVRRCEEWEQLKLVCSPGHTN